MTEQRALDRLWYDQPAPYWEAALPLGNGSMGAMVYGGPVHEEYQLNHDTLWSGPGEYDFNPETPALIEQARAMIRAGKFTEADAFIDQHILRTRDECQSYQTGGSLHLDFDLPAEAPTRYERDLRLDTAVASVRYTCDDVEYTRQAFISYPAQVMCVRLSSSQPGALTFTARMTSPMPWFVPSTPHPTTIAYDGRCASMNPSCRGGVQVDDLWAESRRQKPSVRYQNRLTASATGPNATVTANDGILRVSQADDVILIIAIGTDFCGYDLAPGSTGIVPGVLAAERIAAAQAAGWDALIAEHIADHQVLYDRVHLRLGDAPPCELPTDVRLATADPAYEDPALISLLFQYGRYLLIACSRPGSEPSNLQGIWNDKVAPPWSGRYTVNINTEMNYWPAHICNLAECETPLLAMVQQLAVSGRESARLLYGCRGWCSHHNTDLWRWSAFVGATTRYAFWPISGGWLCQHLWQHVLFTGDEAFLRTIALPVMKGAAEFYLDYLVENDQGHLVTCPATSPENAFLDPETGERVPASEGCAMDQSIIREVFRNVLTATQQLRLTDDEVTAEIRLALPRLAPHTIGSEGQLLEYLTDFTEADQHHRHVSHLYDVYPGNGFKPGRDDGLIDAARVSLERRGPKSTGWGMGWRICLWARLHDGDRALQVLANLLNLVEANNTLSREGGVYRNLFDAHPPFQIDGNFGAAAGIAEMLLQSHDGHIELLPALPSAWPTGSITGLRARGGLTVDLAWSEGALTHAQLIADRACTVRLRYRHQVRELALPAGSVTALQTGHGILVP